MFEPTDSFGFQTYFIYCRGDTCGAADRFQYGDPDVGLLSDYHHDQAPPPALEGMNKLATLAFVVAFALALALALELELELHHVLAFNYEADAELEFELELDDWALGLLCFVG